MSQLSQEVRDAFAAFGRKGGRNRAKNLTPEQLSAIGRKGGEAAKKKRAQLAAAVSTPEESRQ